MEMSDPGKESDEWAQSRLGKLTASRMADAIAKTKAGWSTSRQKYMIELMAERFTGMSADAYLNSAMLWGIETEPAARAAYEAQSGYPVIKAPFVDHPVIPMSGCSPDGFAGDDGLVEIKCPETRTHVANLINKIIPDNYVIQMQWQMACTGRQWCDFCSFDPRMPAKLRLSITRVKRDDKLIAGLQKLAIDFLNELDRTVEIIEGGHLESGDIA